MSAEEIRANRPAAAPPAIEVALQRLIAAQRTHALYPASSPNVRAAVGKLREALAAFPPGSPLKLGVDRECMRHEGVAVLADHKEVGELARRLYLARLDSVAFEPDVTEAEIVVFLDLLRLSEAERAAHGSLEDALVGRGVARILIHEAGRVKLEEAVESGTDPWDAASLEELEQMEKEVLDSGVKGFREALRAVGEGEDAKAGRLTGLLARPVEFATLLLDVASRHRVQGRVDLDAQLAFTLELLGRLEQMIDRLAPHDRARLYHHLEQVVASIVRSIEREILQVALPPYVRLGAVARLFPERIRMLTVKEALGLGLGAGLMPYLMGALRRVAAGDENLPGFLAGIEPPPALDEAALAAYRPAVLAAGLPAPPRLGPAFFDPRPAGGTHPGEAALAQALSRANGVFDSIATLVNLLAEETEEAEIERLLERMVSRFGVCLGYRNLDLAFQVLQALHAARASRLQHPASLARVEAAIGRCGGLEPMRAFTRMLGALPMGSPEIDKAPDLVRRLDGQAIASLLDVLAEEPVTSTRRKLLDLLVKVAAGHADVVLSYAAHARWYVVRNVVSILGHLGPSYVPQLLEIGQHAEPRVRREAVRALGQYRTQETAVAGLIRYLRDRDGAVAREAIHRLLALQVKACAPTLLEVLRDPGLGDREPETILALAKGLGVLGEPDAATPLEMLAAARDGRGWLRSPEVKKALIEAAQAIRGRTLPGRA